MVENGQAQSKKEIKTLFLCLGNICRSTMAHGVFEHIVKQAKLDSIFTKIDSCGTGAYHEGSQPDHRTLKTLKSHGIQCHHRARQLCLSDFSEFDYILCMDRENLRDTKRLAPKVCLAQIMLFGDFAPQDTRWDRIVKDPYYGADDGFARAYDQCLEWSKEYIKRAAQIDV